MTLPVTNLAARAPVRPASAHHAWRDVRNVLVVQLGHMGDVLLGTPAIRAIKRRAPDMRVTLLGSPSGAAAARYIPPIDDAIAYDAPWLGHSGRGDLMDRRLLSALRKSRFDAAVILTRPGQNALPPALMCRLAGVPLRLAHSSESPHGLLTDWLPEPPSDGTGRAPHEVQRQIDLVRCAGFHVDDDRLVFRYSAADVLNMRRKFAAAGADLGRPFIVVHPGATAAARRYPPERFGLAAEAICCDSGCQAVFTGGRDEQALVARAQSQMRDGGVSLAGQLTLGELAALIAGAQVTVCNNGSPGHISAALGTPVVVLYALTHAHATPWKVSARVLNHDVPCRNCDHAVCPEHAHPCLMNVEAQAVARAASELIRVPPAIRHTLSRLQPQPLHA